MAKRLLSEQVDAALKLSNGAIDLCNCEFDRDELNQVLTGCKGKEFSDIIFGSGSVTLEDWVLEGFSEHQVTFRKLVFEPGYQLSKMTHSLVTALVACLADGLCIMADPALTEVLAVSIEATFKAKKLGHFTVRAFDGQESAAWADTYTALSAIDYAAERSGGPRFGRGR